MVITSPIWARIGLLSQLLPLVIGSWIRTARLWVWFKVCHLVALMVRSLPILLHARLTAAFSGKEPFSGGSKTIQYRRKRQKSNLWRRQWRCLDKQLSNALSLRRNYVCPREHCSLATTERHNGNQIWKLHKAYYYFLSRSLGKLTKFRKLKGIFQNSDSFSLPF